MATRQSRRSRQRRRAGARAEGDTQPVVPRVRLVPFGDAVAPARRQHRALVAAAATWALGAGVSLPADMVAYVCAAASESFNGARPLTWWDRSRVTDLLTCDFTNWCSLHRCLRPDGEREAVWRFLDFLAATGRLDSTSDPIAELRKPLRCYGGLDAGGNPDTSDGRDVDCECYRTYRGPTHGELVGA